MIWWRRRESNPRPQVRYLRSYMFIGLLSLTMSFTIREVPQSESDLI